MAGIQITKEFLASVSLLQSFPLPFPIAAKFLVSSDLGTDRQSGLLAAVERLTP